MPRKTNSELEKKRKEKAIKRIHDYLKKLKPDIILNFREFAETKEFMKEILACFLPKQRDSRLPKRGKTAYMLFSTKRRPELSKTFDKKELTKQLRNEWDELDDSQKSEYEDEALLQKLNYYTEMAEYNNLTLSEYNPLKPTPYKFFVYEKKFPILCHYPNMSAKEINAELKRLWIDEYHGNHGKWEMMCENIKN